MQGEQYVNPTTVGLNKLEIKFAHQLDTPVTVLLYATYNSILRIDQARNVKLDG